MSLLAFKFCALSLLHVLPYPYFKFRDNAGGHIIEDVNKSKLKTITEAIGENILRQSICHFLSRLFLVLGSFNLKHFTDRLRVTPKFPKTLQGCPLMNGSLIEFLVRVDEATRVREVQFVACPLILFKK